MKSYKGRPATKMKNKIKTGKMSQTNEDMQNKDKKSLT